jgi:hypothetical protein
MTAHKTRHFTAEGLVGSRVIRVVRTREPFESLTELDDSFRELNAYLDSRGRAKHRLLVDTRQAPSRNDTAFERAFAPHRTRMLAGFERRAVLVRSVVGKLQVQRHAREDEVDSHAFTDEAEALAWLQS